MECTNFGVNHLFNELTNVINPALLCHTLTHLQDIQTFLFYFNKTIHNRKSNANSNHNQNVLMEYLTYISIGRKNKDLTLYYLDEKNYKIKNKMNEFF